MNISTAFAVGVIVTATLLPRGTAQQNAGPGLLYMSERLPNGAPVQFAATSIAREAPTLNWTPSIVHLKGAVRIRMPVHTTQTESLHMYLVVHADEADYDEQTGEIRPRGNVQVTFERPKN